MFSIKTISGASVALAASVFAIQADAATLDLSKNLEVGYQTVQGVRSNTSTYATDLVGAVITATYSDGSSEVLNWFRKSEWSAGIDSSNIGLAASWWGFDLTASNRLETLSFDLAPAGAIFDAVYATNSTENTQTTLGGIPVHLHEYRSHSEDDTSVIGNVSAQYSGLVQMVGQAVGADAFTRLLMDFTGTEGGGFLGQVTLALDMDVLAGGADDLTPVPLPHALLLLLAGLGAFAFVQRVQSHPQPAIA